MNLTKRSAEPARAAKATAAYDALVRSAARLVFRVEGPSGLTLMAVRTDALLALLAEHGRAEPHATPSAVKRPRASSAGCGWLASAFVAGMLEVAVDDAGSRCIRVRGPCGHTRARPDDLIVRQADGWLIVRRPSWLVRARRAAPSGAGHPSPLKEARRGRSERCRHA